MDWISVKDRLPEDGQDVLVYSKHGLNMATYVKGQERCWELEVSWQPLEAFTHWMPLPSPPQIIEHEGVRYEVGVDPALPEPPKD